MSLFHRWIGATKKDRRTRGRRAELSSLSMEDLETRALLSGNVFTRFGHAVTTEWHKVAGTDKPHHHALGINIHLGHPSQNHGHKL